jgi:glutathione peroxidase
MPASIHEFSVRDIHGRERSLAEWRGQVLLVVNVASRCMFTPQYQGLQALHAELAGKGFSVLGFPCDQFGHQEPGDETQILDFCQTHFSVDFPMFEKILVNGKQAHPLYAWLREQAPGVMGSTRIKWNFTKFLVDPEGRVVRRFAPSMAPERLRKAILARLPG